ncbi:MULTISPECIES: PTS sugar transporter subunit IIB [Paenibacillus]|uniref:PTS sugar transporter subunit IIB n=1 Tax=Paenibacillus odorifer TaxID=189426 RepID=A0AB36JLK7_9BACL|nr:PTS sugar transporter subunit IIB [Paenibacillus odorifer]MEC0134290.1 PTS sugar transporter subunit IIB [Paenibacillus odorifer]MEC0222425.1 PTS sugar transporter subunit IIB [Paenibacillus odorifer]OMC96697.1 PTS sugar transporter subunit IIB [Paenibacillus odorifer]OMD03769.1 PTS sugar transporter subunit IIB [Paenibacillus odorifer]OMD15946.1 PTS sugar transporter subunit IIB [Paenibacillus odorifer]
MNTIMLACNAGMSTSLLVTKMQKTAEEKGIQANIFAKPVTEIELTLQEKNVDVILLGPQVKFMKKQLEAKLVGKNIPIEAIDMLHYGMMNGEKVLEQALKIIESK